MAEVTVTADLLGCYIDPATPITIDDSVTTSHPFRIYADEGYAFTERGQAIRYN